MTQRSDGTVVSVAGIAVSFGGNQVLRDISMRLEPGFTGLIGPNGAGKTTLFNVMTGYVVPVAGAIELDGEQISGRRPAQIAQRGIARTFQTPRLVPDLTLRQNVMLGVDGRTPSWHVSEALGLPQARRQERRTAGLAGEMLERFGLGAHTELEARELPLAPQKMVEVARALVSNPRVLLLDEPAAGLSGSDVDLLIEPLREFVAEGDLAVLIIEHDIELVSVLCPKVAVLDSGRIVAFGDPSTVLSLPDVVDAYLGATFAAKSA